MESCCALVVYPDTSETILNYKKLANDPVTNDVWTRALGKEFESLAQGDDLTKNDRYNFYFYPR